MLEIGSSPSGAGNPQTTALHTADRLPPRSTFTITCAQEPCRYAHTVALDRQHLHHRRDSKMRSQSSCAQGAGALCLVPVGQSLRTQLLWTWCRGSALAMPIEWLCSYQLVHVSGQTI